MRTTPLVMATIAVVLVSAGGAVASDDCRTRPLLGPGSIWFCILDDHVEVNPYCEPPCTWSDNSVVYAIADQPVAGGHLHQRLVVNEQHSSSPPCEEVADYNAFADGTLATPTGHTVISSGGVRRFEGSWGCTTEDQVTYAGGYVVLLGPGWEEVVNIEAGAAEHVQDGRCLQRAILFLRFTGMALLDPNALPVIFCEVPLPSFREVGVHLPDWPELEDLPPL